MKVITDQETTTSKSDYVAFRIERISLEKIKSKLEGNAEYLRKSQGKEGIFTEEPNEKIKFLLQQEIDEIEAILKTINSVLDY